MLTPEYEESISIIRPTMMILGIWTESKDQQWYSKYRVILPAFFIFFFIIVPQTTKLIIVRKDLNAALEILTIMDSMCFVALVKMLVIFFNKKGTFLIFFQLSSNQ